MPSTTLRGAARPALHVLVAALAAAVIALGLLAGPFAGDADAASKRTWKQLAQCESSGQWHINTGNGYYGGLQFSRSTWNAYHGRHFARRADNARRIEQIAIAERVQRSQGWGAWPSCSSQLGLGAHEARHPWRIGPWKHDDGFHIGFGAHRH